MYSGILREKLVKLVTFMSDSQSVSHVVAICGVAMCSLTLREFLHLSEFCLVIADSSTSYLTNCSRFPNIGMCSSWLRDIDFIVGSACSAEACADIA